MIWDDLDPRYSLILCDIWGCIHDGVALYPGASDRLIGWRNEGRKLILVTNAPRPAADVERQLARIGLPRAAWDGIATAGEAGIAALLGLTGPLGFLGTVEDRSVLEGRGVQIATGDEFTDLACTGLDDARDRIADYRQDLERWASLDILMHCLNPDHTVIFGGVSELCAGALAEAYEALGGRVAYYGKPHPAIYAHALALGGNPTLDRVLAVGDGLHTDVLGAARRGIACIFVSGGVHAGAPFPDGFAAAHRLGDWAPLGVVASLA